MIRADQKHALVYCDACGWKGDRNPKANRKPCPRCQSTVYLPYRGQGRPRTRELVRVRVNLPPEWIERIKTEGSVGAWIRQTIAARLGVSST